MHTSVKIRFPESLVLVSLFLHPLEKFREYTPLYVALSSSSLVLISLHSLSHLLRFEAKITDNNFHSHDIVSVDARLFRIGC